MQILVLTVISMGKRTLVHRNVEGPCHALGADLERSPCPRAPGARQNHSKALTQEGRSLPCESWDHRPQHMTDTLKHRTKGRTVPMDQAVDTVIKYLQEPIASLGQSSYEWP